MLPWALRLAQDGWRCVLVDLRARHSTGRGFIGHPGNARLSRLWTPSAPAAGWPARCGRARGILRRPRSLALADRRTAAFKPSSPSPPTRDDPTPHQHFKGLRALDAKWLLVSGYRPAACLLKSPPAELDTTTVLTRHRSTRVHCRGGGQGRAPPADVRRLHELASPDSKL